MNRCWYVNVKYVQWHVWLPAVVQGREYLRVVDDGQVFVEHERRRHGVRGARYLSQATDSIISHEATGGGGSDLGSNRAEHYSSMV